MCGIAGLFSHEPNAASVLKDMLAATTHRGPDHTGTWISTPVSGARVALGANRLTIIGLKNGNQPIFNEDKSVVLVCNGEIYNYIELRDELKLKGHTFQTDTDVEVIVHLYEQEGMKMFEELNGQFAFALFDVQKTRLILARDRTGICPLFYTAIEDAFYFGSEIKSLFEHRKIPREIDPSAVIEALSHWSVTPPKTAFKDIFQIRPGEYLVFSGSRSETQRKQYWRINIGNAHHSLKFDELCELTRETMNASVARHLRSDVPVGVYLSGGIDSSILSLLVSDHARERFHTFSIGFEDERFDESRFQNIMAVQLGTTHQHIQCTHSDIAKAFPEVVYHAETILFRCAPVPLYYLSKAVQGAGFKTVLSGEGADEVFWGYDTFRELFVRLMWERNRSSEWRPDLLKRIFPYLVQFQDKRYFPFLKMFYKKTLGDMQDPFYSHRPRWNTNGSNFDLLAEPIRDLGRASTDPIEAMLPESFRKWTPHQRAHALEMITLLAGYLLSSQGDRMQMSHSVEGRFPFLDLEVLKLTAGIPDRWKCKGLRDKFLLREAFKDRLPPEIYSRPKFAYLAPDVASFYSTKHKENYVEEMMSAEYSRAVGIFDPKKVELLNKKVCTQEIENVSNKDNMAVTTILSTHLLHHHFVEGAKS